LADVPIVPTLRALRPAILVLVVGIAGLVFGYWANAAFFPGKLPAQPIDFSHRLHAGKYEIPCQYCHIHARRSISAGVPSVQKCVGCHESIATDRPQIKKLMNYWENREPIPWVKVYDLPDFVYFPHKRHLRAGVECQTCHGPVETMKIVSRTTPMKEEDCLACHKERRVEHGTDCSVCLK
jgi:hypothetical protein